MRASIRTLIPPSNILPWRNPSTRCSWFPQPRIFLPNLPTASPATFLTTLYLATTAPVIVAPAMNVNMWEHPATQANLEILKKRGVKIVEPGTGYLACGMTGAGRLAENEAVVAATLEALGASQELAGETVFITAGPTREKIDPVRYLTNRSSGRMGYALAEAALRRGARVLLVSGPTALTPPAAAEVDARRIRRRDAAGGSQTAASGHDRNQNRGSLRLSREICGFSEAQTQRPYDARTGTDKRYSRRNRPQ